MAQICIAVMKPNSKMQVANLGDSGVRVVRDGRIIFASTVRGRRGSEDLHSWGEGRGGRRGKAR